jgi:hypothetical protein
MNAPRMDADGRMLSQDWSAEGKVTWYVPHTSCPTPPLAQALSHTPPHSLPLTCPLPRCEEKTGAGFLVDGISCSRSGQAGWGVQLLGQWLSKGITTVRLDCLALDSECYIGVVGRK